MPRLPAAALVIVGALGLGACAAHPEAVPVTPPAGEASAVDCAAEWDVGWGSVPAGFEPVAVYVCDPELQLAPSPPAVDPPLELLDPDEIRAQPDATPEPELAPVVPEPRRYEGDLTALLAAFAVPNDPKWPGPCSAIGVVVPDVWLADADGRAIRPAYPVDGCNLPKDGVGDALAALMAG